MTTPRFYLAGDAALTVDWPQDCRSLALKAELAARPLSGVLETVPGLQSLLIRFDPQALDPETLRAEILTRLGGLPEVAGAAGRIIRIPVCYGADLGPDLRPLAEAKNISPEELVALHCSASYTALFLGFLPGFAYLGGLPERLRTSRLRTPRTCVPAGSVALAEDMSAVYPLDSPGGWHLIGRTPVKPFDPERDPPFLLAPGDRITFFAIGRAEFERLQREGA